MFKKYLIWLIAASLTIALGLTGWHFMRNSSLKKTESKPTNVTQGQHPYLPPDQEPTIDPQQAMRQKLNSAIKKFRTATSFRINLTQPSSDGQIIGKIDYIKPLRMHAILSITNKSLFDMIIVGEIVYIRQDQDHWAISQDEVLKDYGKTFFSSMLIADQTTASFGIPSDMPITTHENEKMKCTVYVTKYRADKDLYDIQFCVDKDDNITAIQTQTKDGDVFGEYKDYNAMLSIVRPPLPVLTPSIPGQPSASATSTSSTDAGN